MPILFKLINNTTSRELRVSSAECLLREYEFSQYVHLTVLTVRTKNFQVLYSSPSNFWKIYLRHLERQLWKQRAKTKRIIVVIETEPNTHGSLAFSESVH